MGAGGAVFSSSAEVVFIGGTGLVFSRGEEEERK
jgi:hypothetical protein